MTETPSSSAPKSVRLASLDALRGFDMFWIIGGGKLFQEIVKRFADPMPTAIAQQMQHVPWNGFSAWDLIMPLFLFMVGTSLSFSFAKRLQTGQSKWGLYGKIAWRFCILWLLGTIAMGHLLDFDLSKLRPFCNTLHVIAIGYLIAAVAVIHLPRWGQAVFAAVLLLTYWALMVGVPFGGHPAGTMEPDANLALYIDEMILGSFRYPDTWTWILPSLANGASVLLGVMAGHLLRSEWSPRMKILWLSLMAGGCLLLGWLIAGGPIAHLAASSPESMPDWLRVWWAWRFPINKHLWSSSMVLWAGGWSYLLLALFYLVIDVWGWRRWAFPFVVIGLNAILAYMLVNPFNVGDLGKRYVAGLATHVGSFAPLLNAAASFAVVWGILYYLYRNKHFLKV